MAIATSPAQFAALGGFVLAAIATFLPWETGRTSEWSITRSAWGDHVPQAVTILVLSGAGLLTLVASVWIRRIKWAEYLSLIAGILVVVVGVDAYLNLNEGIVGTVILIIEIGPYVLIAAGIVAVIGSFWGLYGRHSKARSN